MIYEREGGISEQELREALAKSLEGRKLSKVLILPPDFTRMYSGAGKITEIYYDLLKDTCQVDIMPALGTHVPMTEEEWKAVIAVDLSAIFSSPPAFQLIKKLGVGRCMWGTDFPGPCMARTVCATVARKQCWLKPETLATAGAQSWNIGIQTLMAIRQAAIMADLTPAQVEDIFYNNAMGLFHGN